MKLSIYLVLFCCMVGLALAGCGIIGPGIISQNPSGQASLEKSDAMTGEWAELNQELADAKVCLKEFKYDQAIQTCTEILNRPWLTLIDKDVSRNFQSAVYLVRGEAFAGKGFPLIAIDDLDEAVEFGDTDTKPLALVERARVALTLKQWTRAIRDCSSAIRLRPDFGQAFLVRSQALSSAGKTDLATKSLMEAERLGVRTSFKIPLKESAFDQAKQQLELGLPGVAIELLSQSLLRGNNTWEMQGLLAQAQYDIHDYARAIIASNRALKMNPEFADGYKLRGLGHFQQGNYDAAVIDFQSAIALDEMTEAEIKTYLSQATLRGGMAPEFRTKVLSEIRNAVSKSEIALPAITPSEQWLLELNGLIGSSEQIEHLRSLLDEQEAFTPHNLQWLAEYLVLDRRSGCVNNLRSYLQRPLGEDEVLSDSELYLRELTATRSASVAEGLNRFSDQVSYAVFYDYDHLLQALVDAGDCHLKAEHAFQALGKETPVSLSIILPASSFLDRQVKGLLKQAMADQKTEQVRLLITRYNQQLSSVIAEFLGLSP